MSQAPPPELEFYPDESTSMTIGGVEVPGYQSVM